jgi:hypothetical protein
MVKKTKTEVVSNDDFESALKSEPQVFDSLTLGIVRTATGFNIVKVPVDSKGLQAGELEVIDTADSRSEATEKFKINVVRLGII